MTYKYLTLRYDTPNSLYIAYLFHSCFQQFQTHPTSSWILWRATKFGRFSRTTEEQASNTHEHLTQILYMLSCHYVKRNAQPHSLAAVFKTRTLYSVLRDLFTVVLLSNCRTPSTTMNTASSLTRRPHLCNISFLLNRLRFSIKVSDFESRSEQGLLGIH